MKSVAMLLTNAFRPDPRVYKEALSLVQAGYQVSVICWDRMDEFPKQENIDGINILRLNIRSKYHAGSKQLLYLPLFLVNSIHQLSLLKPDVVHCHDLDTTLAGVWYGLNHKIPWIFDAHECYPEQIKPQVSRLIYYILKWLEGFMARKSNLVITVGNALASHLREFTSKVSIVGNYPDINTYNLSINGINRQNLGIQSDAFVVSYIGGFTNARAILPFVSSADHLKCVYLLLAGDGPQREKVIQEISTRKNVYYYGWIPQEQVPTYIMLSDVMYYGLNKSDGNSQYSAPNALFNAMAAGKPILTTAIGEIAQIVREENCGIVIPEATPEFIAQGISAFTEPSARQIMGENARNAAEHKYNWNIAKDNLLNVYGSIIRP